MAATLANKAFSYLVITMDDIVPFITNQDPITYNIIIFISYYITDNFIGIIINIKASKQSTAEYSQFLPFKKLNTGIQLNTTI